MKLLVKTFKKLDFWQKWPFFDTFWPKNPKFWIFPRVPLLIHARRYLVVGVGLDAGFHNFFWKSNLSGFYLINRCLIRALKAFLASYQKNWPIAPGFCELRYSGWAKPGWNTNFYCFFLLYACFSKVFTHKNPYKICSA